MSYLVIKSASNATPESFQLTSTINPPRIVVNGSYLPLATNGGGSLKVADGNTTYYAMRTSTSSYSRSASASTTFNTTAAASAGLSSTTALTRASTSATLTRASTSATLTRASTYETLTRASTYETLTRESTYATEAATQAIGGTLFVGTYNMTSNSRKRASNYSYTISGTMSYIATYSTQATFIDVNQYYYITRSEFMPVLSLNVTANATSVHILTVSTIREFWFYSIAPINSYCSQLIGYNSSYEMAINHVVSSYTNQTTGTINYTRESVYGYNTRQSVSGYATRESVSGYGTTSSVSGYGTCVSTSGYSGVSSSSSSSSESASGTCWR